MVVFPNFFSICYSANPAAHLWNSKETRPGDDAVWECWFITRFSFLSGLRAAFCVVLHGADWHPDRRLQCSQHWHSSSVLAASWLACGPSIQVRLASAQGKLPWCRACIWSIVTGHVMCGRHNGCFYVRLRSCVWAPSPCFVCLCILAHFCLKRSMDFNGTWWEVGEHVDEESVKLWWNSIISVFPVSSVSAVYITSSFNT